MEDNRALLPHTFLIENRNKITLTGVTDIGSFDEENIVVFTHYGEINIHGEALQVSNVNIDSGDFSAEGTVISIAYTEKIHKPSSIFSKVFK